MKDIKKSQFKAAYRLVRMGILWEVSYKKGLSRNVIDAAIFAELNKNSFKTTTPKWRLERKKAREFNIDDLICTKECYAPSKFKSIRVHNSGDF